MMVNRKCDNCDREIDGKCFISNTTYLCEECGDELLIYNDDVDSYIWEEDDKEVIYDDAGADVELFEMVII